MRFFLAEGRSEPPTSPPSELPEGRETALGIISSETAPGHRTRVVHLTTATEPLALPTLELLAHFIWIGHKAQQQREIAALVLWRVIDVHGA